MTNYRQLIAMMAAAAGGGAAGGPDENPKTLVAVCGFECGWVSPIASHSGSPGNGSSIDTTTVRSGSRSYRCNPVAQNSTASIGVTSATGISVARFYIRFATVPSANCLLFYYTMSSAGNKIGVAYHQSSGQLRGGRDNSGVTSFAASGPAVTTGVWYCVDVKLVANGASVTLDIQVDGVAGAQFSLASSITIASNPSIGALAPSGISGDWFYDDFAQSNTSADYPIGPGHVHHFVPVSDGAHSTGTAGNFKTGAAGANITDVTTTSYQLIDDVPMDNTTPDADDYINMAAETGAAANYVEHLIGPASGIPTPTLGPRGIDVLYAYHAPATGTGAHILKVNDNGTEDTVNSFNAAGQTTTRYAKKHYTDPPSAATAWTTATGDGNFNNLRTRFGYSNDGNPDQYLDCVMVEAEFSE